MVSLFRQFSAWSCGALLATCCAQAYADSGREMPFNTYGSYDEVIARVPRQQAEIPSVALAQINIALYHAKQITEARLCAGKWTPRGTLLHRQGPDTAGTPWNGNKGGNNSWHFQSLRHPETLVCPNVTRAEYFMEMSRHLPTWVSVRPAGYETTFRLGQAFTDGQHSLATR